MKYIVLMLSIFVLCLTLSAGDVPEAAKYDPKKFSFIYTSIGSEYPAKTIETINGDGAFFSETSIMGQIPSKKLAGKVPAKDLEEFVSTMLGKYNFFKIPAGLKCEMMVMDSATTHIAITYDGKEHKIGAYHPRCVSEYRAVINYYYEFRKRIKTKPLSMRGK